MSRKKVETLKGFSGEFISRLERVDCIATPKGKRYVVAAGMTYASEEAKAKSDPFADFSKDLQSPEIDAAIDALLAACYKEMKKPGGFFEEGVDC